MMIGTLKQKYVEARKTRELIAAPLFSTLISEAEKIGKDKRNGKPTDEEVMQTIRKFLKDTNQTIKLLTEQGKDASYQKAEKHILETMLPRQISDKKLETEVKKIFEASNCTSSKAVGIVIGKLKQKFPGRFDASKAASLTKKLISQQ